MIGKQVEGRSHVIKKPAKRFIQYPKEREQMLIEEKPAKCCLQCPKGRKQIVIESPIDPIVSLPPCSNRSRSFDSFVCVHSYHYYIIQHYYHMHIMKSV